MIIIDYLLKKLNTKLTLNIKLSFKENKKKTRKKKVCHKYKVNEVEGEHTG